MPVDYTVVFPTRQRFGSGAGVAPQGLETDAPFVGLEKDYSFRCPDVLRREIALLFFRHQGIAKGARILINGHATANAISDTSITVTDVAVASTFVATSGAGSADTFHSHNVAVPQVTATERRVAPWSGTILLIGSNVLREDNTMSIRITPDPGADDVVVDNMVVVFKTTALKLNPDVLDNIVGAVAARLKAAGPRARKGARGSVGKKRAPRRKKTRRR
jgi:hypothetical protein